MSEVGDRKSEGCFANSEFGIRNSEKKLFPVRMCSSFNYVGDDDLGVPHADSLII